MWHRKNRNETVGGLVLLADDDVSRGNWPLVKSPRQIVYTKWR